MKWPGRGLSFEIRFAIQDIITVSLIEEPGMDQDSAIQFFTGLGLFAQFQVGTPITRHY